MILTIVVLCLAVFSLAGVLIAAMTGGPSRLVKQRLASLHVEAAPAAIIEEKITDIRREQRGSRYAWLNRWTEKIDFVPRLSLMLEQANMKKSPEALLLSSLAGSLVVASLVYLRTRALLPTLLFWMAALLTPTFFVSRKRARRFAQFEQQLPEALDMLVSALRVGHSLITGIGALGQDSTEPLGREFRKLFDEQNFGLDLRTAMTNLTTRVPLQDVRIFVAAVLIQKESGGNLAEVLEKVARTTRERFRLKKQIMVHTAQGRLTGLILSILPVALGVALYLINPEGMSILWTRPAGIKMLWGAGIMITLGSIIIQKIVRIRV